MAQQKKRQIRTVIKEKSGCVYGAFGWSFVERVQKKVCVAREHNEARSVCIYD